MCRHGLLAKHTSLDIGGLLRTPQTLPWVPFWKISHQYLSLNNFTVPVCDRIVLPPLFYKWETEAKWKKKIKVPTRCEHPVWEMKGPTVLTRRPPLELVPSLSQERSSCVLSFMDSLETKSSSKTEVVKSHLNWTCKQRRFLEVYQTLGVSPLMMDLIIS